MCTRHFFCFSFIHSFIPIDLYLNSNYSVIFLDDGSSSSNKKTNNFYLIHQQSALIPVQNLLKEKLHSNIEIIQMDEQDCVLEIVDGVLTLVPKEKSLSQSDQMRSDGHGRHSIDDDLQSKKEKNENRRYTTSV